MDVIFEDKKVYLDNIEFTYDKKCNSLTQTKKKLIKTLIASGRIDICTKLIYMNIHSGNGHNKYTIDIYERYAIASRSFDLRPESKIVKWHFEQRVDITLISK